MFSTPLLLFPIKISRHVITNVEDIFNPRLFGLTGLLKYEKCQNVFHVHQLNNEAMNSKNSIET